MKLYRWLLKLYPARFWEEYARQMEIEFADEYREAGSAWVRTRFWIRAIADLSVSIPAEFARETIQDLRHARRMYAKRKFVAAMAVAALAMAIGAATGVFSVVNALLLRELPFREPDRIVEIRGGKLGSFGTKAEFEERRQEAREYLDDGALYTTNLMNAEHAGVPRRRRVTETSANFFSVMGSEPSIGRNFLPDEDDPAKNQAAIISHAMWQQDFGSDGSLLGSKLAVNGVPFTIVGVAPPLFDYPAKTDIWTATGFDIFRVPKGNFFTQAMGRLKPGLTFEQARMRFETIVRRADPKAFDLPPEFRYPENLPHLTPLRDQLAAPIRGATFVLFGTVAFVLTIASVNIAQLLLARLNERRSEFALRAALGASKARLTQQLVVEATALTGTASVVGLLVAQWTTRLMTSFAPAVLESQTYTVVDWRVLGFAAATALLSGLVFGVVPAFALGDSRSHTVAVRRMRTSLVAVQAGLTLVLLAGAYTLGRGFLTMLRTDLGYDTSNVVVLNASLDGTAAASRNTQFYRDVAERLRAVPGVETVGAASHLPLQQYAIFSAATFTLDSGQKSPSTIVTNIGEGYFSAMRQFIVAGRDFTAAEREGKEPALIVNERFAHGTGLGNAVLGHKIDGQQRGTIIGVVRDARLFGPGSEPTSMAYWPTNVFSLNSAAFAVRVRSDAQAYIPILRDAAASVDRSVPFHDIQLMNNLLAGNLARPRFYTTVMIALGGFALLLAAIGIYSVASNAVAQRLKEIGIRIAVGGSAREVRGLLSRQTLLPMFWGLAAGVGGAIALGRYAQSLMASAEPVGAWTGVAASALLLMVCGFAVWRATARVARLDPMQVLRVD